jgi:iron complex outermembrane receptor protein
MKRCAFFLCAVSLVCYAVPLFAQETDEVEVPKITVTYTRGAQDPTKIPADVTVIGPDVIEKSEAGSVPDLLMREAGLNITSFSGVSKFDSVGLRGFARGLETVVMVNGVALNTPTLAEVDWSLIPLSAVERIEIVRGPGSVLWGDKAVAGVINVITKRTFDGPIAEMKIRGGSDDTLNGTLSLGYANERGRVFLSSGYHYTDGYRDNNYYDHDVWSLSAGFTPTDVLELSVDAGYAKDAWGLPGALFDRQRRIFGRRYSHTPEDSGNGENFYALVGANLDLSRYGRLELDYAYKTNDNWLNNLTSTGYVNDTRTYLNENDVSGKYILDHDFGKIENRLTVGVDYRDISYRSDFFTPDWWSMGLGIDYGSNVDAHRNSISYYAYDELTLWERVIVSAGYRYEYIDTSFDSEEWGGGGPSSVSLSEGFSEEAFSAGVTYRYAEGSKAFFRFERGYRVPVLDEIFQYAPPTWTLANTHLDTERVTDFELGIEHVFSEAVTARATFWWSNFENELYYNNLTFVNDTYKETVHRGFDLGVEVRPFDFIECRLGYGYQDAYFDYPPYRGKTVPLVPKHSVTFGIGVEYKGFAIDLDGRYVSDRYRDGDLTNAYETLPSYVVMNARVGYTYRWLEVFAGVDNITDAYYADFGGWRTNDARGFYFDYPHPGTTWYSGIAVRF